MKTIDEMIAVMERSRGGAVIEFWDGDKWTEVPSPTWDWFSRDYRVKPVTKTLEIYIHPNADVVSAICNGCFFDHAASPNTKKVTITWEE